MTKTRAQKLYDMIATPKRQQSIMRFPNDLGLEGTNNIIRFNVNVPSGSKYIGGEGGNPVRDANGNTLTSVRRTDNANSITSRFKNNVIRTDTVVDLFLPPSIQTSYSTNWTNEELGASGAGIDAIMGVINNENGDRVTQTMETLFNSIKAALPKIGTKAIDAITGLNTDAVRRLSSGKLTNPYMEVLFEGINPRTFSFTFKMVPRSASEQETIRDIVKTFKFHQAPEVKFDTQSNIWLFPSEFDITFLYNNTENPWIHKISTCALTNVGVEYTSEGQYTTHNDGSPFSTTLTLEFQEMELLTKERILDGF